MPAEERPQVRPARGSVLAAGVAAWSIYLAIDFLTHAVILSPWWRATESYWLPPGELFRRIPFAYGSFAVYCGTLTWLLRRHYGERPSLIAGLRFGAVAGVLYGGVLVTAAYSVFPMPVSALLVWPVSAGAGSAGAGAAAARVLLAVRPWRGLAVALAVALALLVVGVVIQSLVFPTPANRLSKQGYPFRGGEVKAFSDCPVPAPHQPL